MTELNQALDAIDTPSTVALLQSLIKTRSTNPPAHEITLAQKVHKMFQDTGLQSEITVFEEKRANVVARLKGSGEKPALIYSAHFDTVPEGELPWEFPPYDAQLHDGRIYGRGAADMKSGMAAMIKAAEVLANQSVKLRGDLILAFTSGETSNCIGAQHLVRGDSLSGASAFLVSEPTGLDVGIAEKAALWLRASARGRTSHGSQPHAGSNAIRKLVTFLAKLPEFKFDVRPDPLLGLPTLAEGKIRGGVNINVTPDYCEAEIDVRLLPSQNHEAIKKQFQQLAGSDVTIEQIDFKPAIVTPDDDPFVKICIDARTMEVGKREKPVGLSYFSDGAIICDAMKIPMVILGPGGTEMTHQYNEYCEVDKLVKAARIFCRTAIAQLN